MLAICTPLAAPTFEDNPQRLAGSIALATPTFTLSPNPAMDRVLVQSKLTEAGTVSINLLTMAGQSIPLLRSTWSEAGEQAWKLGIGGVPAGIYLIEMVTDQGTYHERIVIHH